MKHLAITILLSTAVVLCIFAAPKGHFTALEQQQISIATPGLFDKSQSFQVDLASIPAKAYSFPLPVGKVIGSSGHDIELETKKGDAVKSMFEGVVRLSRNTSNYGHVIVVRHDNGLETVYANNAENLVKSGDRVRAGQTIAIVGNKEGKGVLLFFIMVNGNRINPSVLLDIKKHTLLKKTLTFTKSGSRVVMKVGKKTASNKEMDYETNDPFQGNSIYRLNLNTIKNWQWHYPLDDSHVISGYGGARGHSGVDIKNGPGTNVYAAFEGKVVQAGNFAGYGKCITIRHSNGLETRYSHNSKNFVQVGDMVKAGQVIGIVGRTGRATTEHLHFETRIAGRVFNPEFIFDHKNHTLQSGTLQFKKGGRVVRLK